MFVTLERTSFGVLYNDFCANFLYTLSIVHERMRSAVTAMVQVRPAYEPSYRIVLRSERFATGSHNDRR